VNRKAYDEAIAFLNDAVDRAKLDQKSRLDAFRRLRHCLPIRSAQLEGVSTLPEASRDFD
jgi:hypothetical protein